MAGINQKLIQIPVMESFEDVRQAMAKALQELQASIAQQLPITNYQGKTISNVGNPQAANDVVTLKYIQSYPTLPAPVPLQGTSSSVSYNVCNLIAQGTTTLADSAFTYFPWGTGANPGGVTGVNFGFNISTNTSIIVPTTGIYQVFYRFQTVQQTIATAPNVIWNSGITINGAAPAAALALDDAVSVVDHTVLVWNPPPTLVGFSFINLNANDAIGIQLAQTNGKLVNFAYQGSDNANVSVLGPITHK